MPAAGFESAIPASDRPQTVALDRSAAGIGTSYIITVIKSSKINYGKHKMHIKIWL